ncbi:putative protein Mb0923 [Fibrisoma limi BUZ 3]|uniref:OmpA family protein n=1 Tax=Fibrisoma limi BUZ 3 TaxID=1185876 RepID=I2GDC2_9BACT|nr:PA14 domain-containing protein [Fibrisoma limi]CCH51896.1 putative protein Mb0923 [Fibrisoma limi BUZ 3]
MCRACGFLVVLWGVVSGSGFAQSPSSRQAATHGLKGEYFNGPNFEHKVLTRIDPQVSFDWNWQMPGPGVPREYFSVRWTGKLYAPRSGKYQFSATVDDGVRVWVGGKKVIDEWRKQDDTQFVGEIILKAGNYYDLKVEYYNDWKGSIIYLFWKLPVDKRIAATTSPEVISANFLVPSFPTKPKVAAAKPPVVSKPNVVAKPSKPVATATRSLRPVPPKTAGVGQPVAKNEASAPAPVSNPINTFETLTAGTTLVLQHVLFEQSSYVLLPESYTELNRLLKALQKHPAARLEISGHTDNVGDPRLNLALSENRAKVVANYLVRRGIAENRLDAKGYGGTRPVAGNNTESERAKNRRVEIQVR